jgi:ABC-type Fe3+/spermidine/putrescine transport system ATPase subunit
MTDISQTSRLQQAIDIAEALSLEEQQLLLEILAKRLHRKQRQQLLEEVQEIRQEVAEGGIKYGSVKDFLAELDA